MPRTTRRNPLSVALCGLLTVSGAFAQPPEDRSHFEVASIKPVDHTVPYHYTGPSTGDPGRIVISRISARELIWSAYPNEYGMFGERISGPPWIEDEYSLAATIPPGSRTKDLDQMFRNLLAERFGLKFHDVDKEVRGFELTIGQSGFKLTPSTAEVLDRDGSPTHGTWGSSSDRELGVEHTSFHQCSVKQLADMLTMTYGARSVPVLDKTEIEGRFDFRLDLPVPSVTVLPPGVAAHMPAAARMRNPETPDDSVADLRGLSGSLERQTGLRLKAVKLTLRAMVIDSVARMPTQN